MNYRFLPSFAPKHLAALKLIGCAILQLILLNVTKILEERIFTKKYSGETFTSPAIVFYSNSLITLGMTAVFLKLKKESFTIPSTFISYALVGLGIVFSLTFNINLIYYTSVVYTALLSWLLPISLISFLAFSGIRKFSISEYASITFLSMSSILFFYEDLVGTEVPDFMLALSLLMTCLSLEISIMIYHEKVLHRSPTSFLQHILFVNIAVSVILFFYTLVSGQLYYSFIFFGSHPLFFLDLLGISVFGAFRQVLMFYILKEFGATYLSTVESLQYIGFTMFACMVTLHPIAGHQWFAVLLIAAVVGLTILRKN